MRKTIRLFILLIIMGNVLQRLNREYSGTTLQMLENMNNFCMVAITYLEKEKDSKLLGIDWSIGNF